LKRRAGEDDENEYERYQKGVTNQGRRVRGLTRLLYSPYFSIFA